MPLKRSTRANKIAAATDDQTTADRRSFIRGWVGRAALQFAPLPLPYVEGEMTQSRAR